jgi:RNA polymerase sigma-70 factor (ECF subfamily)
MTTATIDALWAEYHGAIYQYIQKRIYSNSSYNQDVEDLTSDVFERALSAMQRGLGYTENARAWLFRIAHNLVIDTYRQRDRAGLTFEDIDAEYQDGTDTGRRLADTLPADDLPLDTLVVQQELQQRVRHALTALQPDQQTVLTLRMAEYTYDEIAIIMGKTIIAVKGDAYRGRESLRLRLSETSSSRRGYNSRAKLYARISALLTERGPLRASQIAATFGMTARHITEVLSGHPDLIATHSGPNGGICTWGVKGGTSGK